jgi:hypothetical protein
MVLFIIACSNQSPQEDLSSEEIAETMIAQLAIAELTQDAPTSMPASSPTPEPVTITLPLAPMSNPVPMNISDDFSTQKDIWGECAYCKWEDGALYFGPYPPRGVGQDQVFWVICEACGEHRFYRVAADVTYFEGVGATRTYGLLAGLREDEYVGGGTITTTQHALYEVFDLIKNEWVVGTVQRFGSVNPGRQTNRIEVTLREGSIEGMADINVTVNGKILVSHYNQEVDPTQVGLYLGWHTIGVKYDNFEFESYEYESDSQTLWVDPGAVEADPFPQGLLANAPTFVGSEGISVGGSSADVEMGDFNSDGISDLAVAVDSSSRSGVLLAVGDGSFEVMKGMNIPKATDVEAADFNGDGHLDLAFISPGTDEIYIVLGNGEGDFRKPIIGSANPEPRSLTIADFNLDNRPDLAIANFGSNDITLFLGKGNGSFTRGVSVPVGMEPASIDHADFNQDGNPDLAVVNLNTGDVSVLLGDGSGDFSTPIFYFVDFPSTITTADVNHDGKSDMVFANPDKSIISVMLGNGMGEFYVPIYIPTEQPANSLVVVDLNQDGTLDLATANTATHDVSIYLGDRIGNFGLADTFELHTYPVSLAAGDFNQDGLVDLSVANFSGGSTTELAHGKRVTASNSQIDKPPECAVDPDMHCSWASNQRPPGWIEVDLGDSYAITKLTLKHSADGLRRRFVHIIEGKGSNLSDAYWELFRIDDYATDGEVYTLTLEEPVPDIRYIRLRTTTISQGNLPPGWSDIKVYGSRRAPVETDQEVDMKHVFILFQTDGER